MSEDTLTVKEVAELFGKSLATIYAWESKGLINPIYTPPSGKGKLYSRIEMEKLYQKGFRKE